MAEKTREDICDILRNRIRVSEDSPMRHRDVQLREVLDRIEMAKGRLEWLASTINVLIGDVMRELKGE